MGYPPTLEPSHRYRLPSTSMAESSSRVAVVTGAAQGIGLSIALRLAEDGLDVAVNDITPKASKIDEVVAQIHAKGRRSLALLGDVSNENDVKTMVDKVVDELGGIDVVRTKVNDTRCPRIDCACFPRWWRMQGSPYIGPSSKVRYFGQLAIGFHA